MIVSFLLAWLLPVNPNSTFTFNIKNNQRCSCFSAKFPVVIYNFSPGSGGGGESHLHKNGAVGVKMKTTKQRLCLCFFPLCMRQIFGMHHVKNPNCTSSRLPCSYMRHNYHMNMVLNIYVNIYSFMFTFMFKYMFIFSCPYSCRSSRMQSNLWLLNLNWSKPCRLEAYLEVEMTMLALM